MLRYLMRFECFLDAHNGAITAVATVIIGLFTIALAIVGRSQAVLTRDAINLARAEFTASHRPRIIMRDVNLLQEGGDMSIIYMLINSGGNEATVIESWLTTELIQKGTSIRNLRSAGHNDLGPIKIAAGEVADLIHIISDERARAYIRFGPGSLRLEAVAGIIWNLYFTGAIVYQDSAGNRRRSVFRRQWDPEREGFYRTDDPDHEYAD